MMEHYFSKKPSSRFETFDFDTTLLGEKLRIRSAPSIFSSRRIDFGTRLLAENAIISGASSLLDLGCGYGAVGIAIKKSHPDIKVTMSDVNARAILLAKRNCKENNSECEVLQSDLYGSLAGRYFDTILVNPPFSAGKKLCIEIIRQSPAHLRPGGTLQLVAPHNKGGASLKKTMHESFGNAEAISKKGGYQVYLSKR
jgi:16S rRNA (guanine1207-N2)-methyltransferase